MELYEYQTHVLLQRFGIPLPPRLLIEKGQQIEALVKDWDIGRSELRPQYLAYEPPMAVSSREELFATVSDLFSRPTPPKKILLLQPSEFARSFSLQIDITSQGEIELKAFEKRREDELQKTVTETCLAGRPLYPFQINRLRHLLGIPLPFSESFTKVVTGLYCAFTHFDVTSLIVTTLGLNEAGLFEVQSAQMFIDDHALFRQNELSLLFDEKQRATPWMIAPSTSGTIACIASGTEAALATADLVRFQGGVVAYAADMGEELSKLQELLEKMSQQHISTVLINFYYGIREKNVIVKQLQPIIERFRQKLFIVLRLDGTNGPSVCKTLSSLCATMVSLQEAVLTAVRHKKETSSWRS